MTPDDERRAAAVPGVPVADRLRALADAPWSERGDAATQAALREGADAVERLAAVARGAQYRAREALAPVGVLRAWEDARADGAAHHDVLAASVGALDGVGAAGDLAALARREAGPVTRRQWRACARCGRCFWLADTEAMPGHGVRDAWGADRACGAVVTSEGSEGR